MEPAHRFEDLVVWQLASRLEQAVFEMTERGRAAKDRRLRSQIRDSSASVPANLAEGFGHFYPRENARFVRIAKASLTETQNHLLKGRRLGYWTRPRFSNAWRLSKRTMGALVPYLLYLESCDGEVPPSSDTPKAPPGGGS